MAEKSVESRGNRKRKKVVDVDAVNCFAKQLLALTWPVGNANSRRTVQNWTTRSKFHSPSVGSLETLSNTFTGDRNALSLIQKIAQEVGYVTLAEELTQKLQEGTYLHPGQAPTLAHVKGGAVMKRRSLLEKAKFALKEIRHELPQEKVPVFWINGPPGVGKSVLLMQLLQKLEGKSEQVRTPVEVRNASKEYLFWDDAFAPGLRDVTRWDQIYNYMKGKARTLVVTGAPEHRKEFQPRGMFEVIDFSVPGLDQSERGEFAKFLIEQPRYKALLAKTVAA